MADGKCKDEIRASWRSRSKGIDELLRKGEPDELDGYFLSICYHPAGEENDLLEGFAEFLISWGGPSEELQVFFDMDAARPYKALYWYKDWFDGASINVTKHRTTIALFERYMSYLKHLKRDAMVSGTTECLR